MTRTFAEIKGLASLAETTVRLVLGGEHLEQLRQLEKQLQDAPLPQSLADANPARLIAEQIVALQEEMAGSEIEFRLRAMPGRQWDRLKMVQPVRHKNETDDAYADRFFDWTARLVSMTCVEPVMTPAEVAELVDLMPGSSWDELSGAAWGLNSGKLTIPFSAAAYGSTLSSGATSRRPSSLGSPSDGSAATSPEPSPPPTSTTPSVE